MRTHRRMLTQPLTRGRLRGAGSRAGATQSEAQKVAGIQRPQPRMTKVIDRDAVLDLLSQLRDRLDQVSEQVNDLAVIFPSLQPVDGDEEIEDDCGDLWSDDEEPEG